MVKPSSQTVSPEEVIHLFRDLVMPSLNPKTVRIEALLESFFAFYRDTRIEGAWLEEEGDMLLLEWGGNCPHLIKGFKDFREGGDDEVDFDENEYEWIGLTRQVTCGTADPDEEAEGEAVGLCLFIYFGKAGPDDDEAGDSLSVPTPNALPAKLKEFKKNPYVAKLLKHKPSKITAFVSGIG
jgi:hypothetical protein